MMKVAVDMRTMRRDTIQHTILLFFVYLFYIFVYLFYISKSLTSKGEMKKGCTGYKDDEKGHNGILSFISFIFLYF